MKRWLNPLIEAAATRGFGVDQYADIFESLALRATAPALVRRLFGHKIAADIRGGPLLFIHVPKNGGTSIKRSLYASDPGHATIRYYDLLAPDMLRAARTLALLREPVDRFLSGFDFLINRGGSDVTIQVRPLRRIAHVRSIDDFLDYLESIGGDWLKVDTFVRPQYWYLADKAGMLRIDHVWLLGEQNAELAEFLDSHGVHGLSHVNRTARVSRSVTAEQEQRLRAIYAVDFALYDHVARAAGNSACLAGLPIAHFASRGADQAVRATASSISISGA